MFEFSKSCTGWYTYELLPLDVLKMPLQVTHLRSAVLQTVFLVQLPHCLCQVTLLPRPQFLHLNDEGQ